MKKTIGIFCFLMNGIFFNTCLSQDADGDNLNDQLETALAKRFAPEWRFNKKIPGDGSNQNKTEQYYPASIEWFFNKVVEEAGQPPRLAFGRNTVGLPIQNINQLDFLMVGTTNETASSTFWGNCDNPELMLLYPKKIPGDPFGFPTYFHCYPLGNGKVSIGYMLFYPYDYKGSYFGLSFGNHRGDWEGINVVVSNLSGYNDPALADMATLDYVKFSGHGMPKYIKVDSPRFHKTWITHPKVYISWGSHTTYPEPGEWHNFKISGPTIYDDFFHGNGLVIQSWQPSRKLVNMGETEHPFVGWLNYKGKWGPDDSGENSSPPSPPCKSSWNHNISGYYSWEEYISNPSVWSQKWKNPFE